MQPRQPGCTPSAQASAAQHTRGLSLLSSPLHRHVFTRQTDTEATQLPKSTRAAHQASHRPAAEPLQSTAQEPEGTEGLGSASGERAWGRACDWQILEGCPPAVQEDLWPPFRFQGDCGAPTAQQLEPGSWRGFIQRPDAHLKGRRLQPNITEAPGTDSMTAQGTLHGRWHPPARL